MNRGARYIKAYKTNLAIAAIAIVVSAGAAGAASAPLATSGGTVHVTADSPDNGPWPGQ
jgi:hypothetical protein